MKNKKLSLIILFLILIIPFSIIYATESTAYKICDIGGNLNIPAYPPQRQLWFSTLTDRFWIFFEYGDEIYYSSSLDGETWDNPPIDTTINMPVGTFTYDLATWIYEEDGTAYMHIVWTKYSWYNASGAHVYYRMIQLNNDGSITLINSTQIIYTTTIGRIYKINICVDSSGYPVIQYMQNIDFFVKITRSSTKNGVWTHDTGYPMSNFANSLQHVGGNFNVIPLSDRKLYAIQRRGTIAGFDGRLYNGTGWETEENDITLHATYPLGSFQWSTSEYDNDIYFTWMEENYEDIMFRRREYDNSSWYDIVQVYDNPTAFDGEPEISLTNNGTAYIFWSSEGNNPVTDYIVWMKSNNYGLNWTDSDGNNNPESWINQIAEQLDYGWVSGFFNERGGYMGVAWSANNSENLMFAHLFEGEEEDEYPQPEILNITIRGYEDYLFEGEVYEVDSYWNNTDYCYFQLSDTVNSWRYYYYNETKYMGINVIGFEGLKENEFIAGTIFTNYTYYNASGINQNVSRLQWRFILGVQVVDCFNRTLSYYGENKWGNVTSGDTTYDEINIYNLGGYVTYSIQGDAGRILKGDAWELWAENGTVGNPSYAYAETIFRKLQHVHFLVEIDLDLEWNSGNDEFDFDGGGYVEYGIDYRMDQLWVTGWKVRIYPQLTTSIDVGNHGGGDDQNWIYWSIEWYYNNSIVDQDFIYSNCYGYDHFDSRHGYTNRTSAQLWVDLWFNKMNASTVIAGRVNSYYYGCYEQGNPWWFGYGAFRPMTGDRDASMYFDDLKDINGTIFSCQELEIIRAWANVTKWDYTPDAQDTKWEIMNYEILNFLTAQDRMKGIDTPIFVQTKILEVTTQHGFLQPLWNVINNLGATIWNGVLGVTKTLWGAMDSLLLFMGFPEGTWSRITYFIMAIPNLLVTLINYIPMILDNMISLIGNMFGFLTITIGRFIWFLGHFATTWITWVTEIINFFTGGFSGIRNLWELLDLEQWFMLFITIIFPMWWIERVWTSKNSLKQLQDDLKTFSSFYTGIFNFLKDMVILIRNLLGAIRSVLPI